MTAHNPRISHPLLAATLMLATLFVAPAANAQLGDMIKKGAESGAGALGNAVPGGGAAAGGAGGLLGSAGIGNVSGLLQFCAKNNFLGDGAVSSVQQGLMGKLGGQGAAAQDSGYQDGAKGILSGGDGQKMDLGSGGGSLKEQATRKICDQVLSRGKSLL